MINHQEISVSEQQVQLASLDTPNDLPIIVSNNSKHDANESIFDTVDLPGPKATLVQLPEEIPCNLRDPYVLLEISDKAVTKPLELTKTSDANITDYKIIEEASCSYMPDEQNSSNIENFSDFQSSGSEYFPEESDSDLSAKHESSRDNNDVSFSDKNCGILDNSTTNEVNLVDDRDMFVNNSSNKSKKLFCMFCNKFQTKFARHLETVHKDTEEVKRFKNLPKGSLERRNIIDKIRKKSQFFFNTNYMVNDGELIVTRRPSTLSQKKSTDFKSCQNCRGFYTKNNIRHHAAQCFSYSGKNKRTLMTLGRKLEARIHPEASEIVKKIIFPVLRDDDISRNIRYDRLLILYANKMACKYRLQHQHDLIRSNLRSLGRFLITIKDRNHNVKQFSDIYDTEIFNDVIISINTVAGFDDLSQTYRAPSTAYSLGSLIKKIAYIYITDCIKQKDKDKKNEVADFLKILNEDLAINVNKTVAETQTQHFRRKTTKLPTQHDIQTLHRYLNNKKKVAFADLSRQVSLEAWKNFAESTLILIQLFNRRRAGEIERMLIDDFRTYQTISDADLKNLTTQSQNLAKNYVRFYIRGKLNRTVPVLLSLDMVNSIDLILKHREAVGVSSKNIYVFGTPNPHNTTKYTYFRACKLLREHANECGAEFPLTLRGTTLRKHVATHCINLYLSEDEIRDVANFMGHSDDIHKRYYRQPIITREIVRMSRVLQKAQGMDQDDTSSESDSDELQTATNTDSTRKSNSIEKSKSSKKRSTSPYGSVKAKKRWTEQENSTAFRLFSKYIEDEHYPSLSQIQNLVNENPELKGRSPRVIKTWLSNKIKKNKINN